MENPRIEEVEVEIVPLNVSAIPEVTQKDEKDGIDTQDAEANKPPIREVSFIHKLESSMKQYFHLAKIGIFIVAAILFLLFLVWDVVGSGAKPGGDEKMNKLMKVMQMQAGGNFAPIREQNTTSTASDD